MAITPLPTPPSREDPNNFAARADALLAALMTFVTECNAMAAGINANEISAAASASTATTKAGDAAAARDIALAAANYKGLWSALSGALAIPATVYHSSAIWMLTQSVASVGAEVPGVSTKWVNVTPASGLGSAAYQPASAFQPAIGTFTGPLKSNGAGDISVASAADLVAAIGATPVQSATSATSATSASSAEEIVDGAVSSAAKIANGIITLGKMVNVAAAKLIGRSSASEGSPEEITVGSGLSMTGNTLVNAGVSTVAGISGAITPAQISAAASVGYGYTPVSPVNLTSYVAKDNNSAIGAMGVMSWSSYAGTLGAYVVGTTYSPVTGTWRLLQIFSQTYDGGTMYYNGTGIFQRIA
jgi:hypothetical protein